MTFTENWRFWGSTQIEQLKMQSTESHIILVASDGYNLVKVSLTLWKFLFSQIFGHIQMLNGFEKNLHSGREKPRGTFKMLVESWNTFTVLDTLDHKNVQNTRKVDLFSVQFDRFDALATLDCPAPPEKGSTASFAVEAESKLVLGEFEPKLGQWGDFWARIWITRARREAS